MSELKEVVVVSGVRLPVGSYGGSLKNTPAIDMGAMVVKEAVKRAGIEPSVVDEVIIGQVGEVAENGFVARAISLKAGMPKETTAYSVNRQCGSGLQSIVEAVMEIQTGQADVVVAGGAENISQLPYYVKDARWGARMGHKVFEDGVIDILTWPLDGNHNGVTAENEAEKYNVSREEQDQFALESHQKACKAIKDGKFKDEILPVELKDRKGNITFDDMFMSGDALSICQAVKANRGKVIVQVDRLVDTPSRPRNAIIPGCLVDAIVVAEPEERNEAYTALAGSFEIPYKEWHTWNEKINDLSQKQRKNNVPANIIGKRAAKELRVDDIVNIGIGIPEMVSRYARKSGMLDMITLTVESGGIGGFPVSGEAFGAMIGAASVYDMANQFDLYDNGGLDICFMGGLEADRYGNINAHRGTGAFAGIGGFANITAKTPTVVFCMTFNAKGLEVTQEKGVVTIHKEGEIPKFVENVSSISFSAKRAIENGQKVLYVTERCVFRLTPKGLKLIEVYPGVDMQKDILDRLPFEVEV